MTSLRAPALCLVFLVSVVGCALTPVIQHRTYEKADGIFRTVAVVPGPVRSA